MGQAGYEIYAYNCIFILILKVGTVAVAWNWNLNQLWNLKAHTLACSPPEFYNLDTL